MRREITQLFWETYCVLHIGWDPNKDPEIKLDPSGGFHQFSHTDPQELLRHCAERSRAPTALYKSLEVLSGRAGLLKRGALGAGPSTKMLASSIKDTKTKLEEIVLDMLNQLYVLATSLDITINVLRREEHEGIRERSLDLLESVNTRILRLIRLRERLNKRI